MLALLKRALGIDAREEARALHERLLVLETLTGADRALDELTQGKGTGKPKR